MVEDVRNVERDFFPQVKGNTTKGYNFKSQKVIRSKSQKVKKRDALEYRY